MSIYKALLFKLTLLSFITVNAFAVSENHSVKRYKGVQKKLASSSRGEKKTYIFEVDIVSQILTDEEYVITTSDGRRWFGNNAGKESWIGDAVKVARKMGWEVGDRLGISEQETLYIYPVTNLDRKNSKMHLMCEGYLPDYSHDFD